MLDERIGPHTQRFAVLGETLGHTWSPYIHNTLFLRARRDAVYLPVTVPRDKLASAVDVLRSSFEGFNVTIPYKEQIIPFLDETDDAVRACGAVNTVENRNGKLIGHITDGMGMLRAIEECGIRTQKMKVLILGGGGAARVAGYEFLSRGGSVCFAVRNKEKGQRLIHELAQTQPDGLARIRLGTFHPANEQYDLLVNCTPVGMFPQEENCPVEEEMLNRCKAVFDAVYNPRKTKLLSMAQTKGIPCAEGLGMLFYQAVEAQNFWFGSTGVSEIEMQEVYQQLAARFS